MTDHRNVVVWERDGEARYARVESVAANAVAYLIVEPVPSGAWDWQVWPHGAGAKAAVHGITLTRPHAMKAAEWAAAAFISSFPSR